MIKNRNRETALEQQTYFWSVKNSSQEIINFGQEKKCAQIEYSKKFLFCVCNNFRHFFLRWGGKNESNSRVRFAFVCFSFSTYCVK